jgi:hypothetical protein
MADSQRSFVSRTATKSGSLAGRFFLRWLVWTVVIGTPAYFLGEQLWPHVYKLWGPPLGVFQDQTYQAVLFGDFVSAVLGGAAVAFVDTFRRR